MRRRSWDIGSYDEVLRCGRSNVDLSRADNMSLLDTHGAYNLDDRLGTVVPGSIRFERGQVIAKVKLSRKARAEDLLQDLQDGMSLPVSVGYRILKEERTEADQGEVPTVTATLWQPMEISVVPIPADPNAKTRGIDMPQNTEHARHEQQQAPTNIINERTRVKELRALARTVGIDDTTLERAIDEGASIADFRNQALDAMVERQERSPTFPHSRMDDVRHGGMTRSEAMADALMVRVSATHKPQDTSRQFVGLSCVELARQALEGHGFSTHGMAAGQVIERALHTTSDFAMVISQVGQTTLQTAYDAVPSALKAAAKKTTAKDFKAKTAVRLGGFSNLEKVNEHGEFKRGTFSESAESLKLETFGKVFGMTRQMLVNDDLGAFANVAQILGKKASDLEAKNLADLLKSNPKMGDGKALFHADHKNLGTAAALSVDVLSIARTSFRKQTDDTGELIGVGPRYLVVGADLETQAEKILTAIQANQTANVNVFAGKLELLVEPRLTDPTAWYLAAPSEQVPGLEYAYLEGEEGPQFFENYGFNIDGVEIKVRLDFGASFMDWRGWYRNAGA
ncbi:Mu-like prophage major head subunit gpT family protein [Agrobacterium vitis]|nr:prohead protease/major capsid protein fusion protein [Agrobacterium vitis]NSZ19322.1 peptidase U35 [Agrobacterium vitis]QZO06190.1 Mu-like prophage major head subunit gpT family protein [Agrobacterium vitis]UJL90513.1 Mu-like prophage major head subunit gpT family protein [Agrobacterium vitis]